MRETPVTLKRYYGFGALLVAATTLATDVAAEPIAVECPSGIRVEGTAGGVHRALNQARPYLDRLTEQENLQKNPYGIYPLQVTTANIMRYAEQTNDVRLLQELIPYFERALAARTVQNRVASFYVRDHTAAAKRLSVVSLPRPTPIWRRPDEEADGVAAEYMLPAAQFLYATLRLMRAGMEIAPADPFVSAFTGEHAEEIVNGTLLRWVDGPPPSFSRRGWGCNDMAQPHRALVQKLIGRSIEPLPSREDREALCNSVTDTDLFVIGMAAETLLLNRKLPGPFLSDDQEAGLTSYLRNSSALMKQRHVVVGRSTHRALFDPGSYDLHPDYRDAGSGVFERDCFLCRFGDCRQMCKTFPSEQRASPLSASGLGWDLSHARRLPLIYDSMRRVRTISGADFPTSNDEAQLARQFSEVVWNGNEEKPRFSNFWDGTDGWYRVEYGGRKGVGYAPGSFVMDVATFGYSFWAQLDDRVATALRAAVRQERKAVCAWLSQSDARALMLAPELVNIGP